MLDSNIFQEIHSIIIYVTNVSNLFSQAQKIYVKKLKKYVWSVKTC